MLELKRGDRAREVVEFITLPFPSSKDLKLVSSGRTCAEMAKKCTQKRDARTELLFC